MSDERRRTLADGDDTLYIDIEVFNELDLTAVGVYKYAEHASAEVLTVQYRFGRHGPATVWVPRHSLPAAVIDGFVKLTDMEARWPVGGILLVQKMLPIEIRDWVNSGKKVSAHNANYERVVLNGVAGRKIDFPHLTIEQMHCTAAKSRGHGLPGKLGDVAKALGTHPKNDAGRGVMLQLTRPKKPTKKDPATRYTPENAPDKFIGLYVYGADDVYAECGVDEVVPDLSESETRVWRLDQRINDKGVYVDIDRVNDIRFLIAEYRKELREECLNLTWDFEKDEGIEPTQRGKIADWIRANGWPYLTDMQAETVKDLLTNEKVPKKVKKILAIYSTYGMKAVAKFDVMAEAVCADGRVKGMFIFAGAGPGRWSSVLIQLQNMARGHIDDPLAAIEACRMRDLAWIKEMYPGINPMKVFASCVRGMLVAPPGKKLVSFDFAGIESRVGAWLAGETWKLLAFLAFDAGLGPDLYVLAYSRAFRIPIEQVTKKLRQIGKVMELALGYEGGVGAFITMVTTYGVDLEELTAAIWDILPEDVIEQAEWLLAKQGPKGLDRMTFIAVDSIKRLWRRNHPAQVQLWRDLKDAAILAIQKPGSVFSIPNKKIMFKVESRWLYMRLPSGRKIAYYEPQLSIPKVEHRDCKGKGCAGCDESGKVDGAPVVTYMGIDTDTRRWMRVSTYGGKILENGDQGFSSCLLRKAMLDIDEVFYDEIIMTVHDECVLEVDEDKDALAAVMKLACRVPRYAEGLPLAAEGWEGREYRK